MPMVLLSLFILVPLIEVGVFIEVGGIIGLWPTLAVIVLSAIAGSALIRHQGLAILGQAQKVSPPDGCQFAKFLMGFACCWPARFY